MAALIIAVLLFTVVQLLTIWQLHVLDKRIKSLQALVSMIGRDDEDDPDEPDDEPAGVCWENVVAIAREAA